MLDIYKLNELIKEKKFTNKHISQVLANHGIKKSETAIQKYRHGINDPDTKTLSILADILDVTEQDFFVGSKKRKEKIALEEIKTHPHKYKHIYEKQNVKNELKQIQLINDTDIEYIYIDNYCLKKETIDDEIFAFISSGDSMTPYINDGDIVLYKNIQKSNIKNDGKYIIDTKVGLQVKNLKFMINGDIRIISENHFFRTFGEFDEEIPKEYTGIFDIVGVVVGRILKS
ncbi:MAG: S24 family peptidase [Campylobacterota bacterium]|nr:S24 family peptidase [Campylobacterota bacterium]